MVAHVIIVSAQSKELGFGFFRLGLTLESGFGACWDRVSVRRTAEAKQIYMFYRNGFSLRAKRNLND